MRESTTPTARTDATGSWSPRARTRARSETRVDGPYAYREHNKIRSKIRITFTRSNRIIVGFAFDCQLWLCVTTAINFNISDVLNGLNGGPGPLT